MTSSRAFALRPIPCLFFSLQWRVVLTGEPGTTRRCTGSGLEKSAEYSRSRSQAFLARTLLTTVARKHKIITQAQCHHQTHILSEVSVLALFSTQLQVQPKLWIWRDSKHLLYSLLSLSLSPSLLLYSLSLLIYPPSSLLHLPTYHVVESPIFWS